MKSQKENHDIPKLTPPRTTGVVPRKRLYQRLDGTAAVTWISSPAGSGKTTLAADYVSRKGGVCLWYQIDEGDADPSGFFYYLGQALKKAVPRKRKPMPLLTPEYLKGAGVFARRYFEELASPLPQGSILVFDDYHTVPEASPFHQIFHSGVNSLPEGIQVLIMSRRHPPEVFARSLAYGKLNVIAWDEMRLNSNEASGLLDSLGLDDHAPGRESLISAAGGWISGLLLITRSGGLPGGVIQGDAGSPELFSYFVGEVFRNADEQLKAFLMRTSWLTDFSPHMASRLTEPEASPQMLDRLVKENFFIENFGSGRKRFRYHPLFRSFLQNKAANTFSTREVVELKRRSAKLAAEEGEIEEALSLCSESGDWDAFCDLLARHGRTFIEQGRNETLNRFLHLMPEDIYGNHPWLTHLHGISLTGINLASACQAFELSYQRFLKQEDAVGILHSIAGAVDAISLEWDDFHLLDVWMERLEAFARGQAENFSPQLEAIFTEAAFKVKFIRSPWKDELSGWMERGSRMIAGKIDPIIKLKIISTFINIYIFRGEYQSAKLNLIEAKRIFHPLQPPPFIDIYLSALEIYLLVCADADPGAALSRVEEKLSETAKIGVYVWDHLLLSTGVQAALMSGNVELARNYLERKMHFVSESRRHVNCKYNFVTAHVTELEGNKSNAYGYAEIALAVARETGFMFPEMLCDILMADFLLRQGREKEAVASLEEAAALSERSGSMIMQFMVLLLRSFFCFSSGDEEKGLAALAGALKMGKEKRYFTMFWWWSPEVISHLCVRALENKLEEEYVRTFVVKNSLFLFASPEHLDSWPWPVKVRIFGVFDVLVADKPVDTGKRSQQKPLALLRLVALSGPEGIASSRLTDLLWPEAEGDKAQHALEMALSRLRKLLKRDDAVEMRGGRVRLNSDLCWVDARAFAVTADRGLDTLNSGRFEEGLRLLERVLPLYRGHIADNDGQDHWAISARERLRMKYLLAIEALADACERAGDPSRALDLYRKGIETDELSEELCRRYMRCCLQSGRRSEALTAYQRLERALKNGIGIAPSDETRQVMASE